MTISECVLDELLSKTGGLVSRSGEGGKRESYRPTLSRSPYFSDDIASSVDHHLLLALSSDNRWRPCSPAELLSLCNMTFHRRCAYFFLDLFSISALIALAIEIVLPWMLKANDKCYGIVYNCDKCQKKEFLISLVAASIAGCIIAIMTVFAVVLSFGSCRSSSSCSHSMFRFTLAYILLDVVALISNIVAMALWVKMDETKSFGPSFWVGWAANGMLLILLVILVTLRTRGGSGDGSGDYNSQTSADQPLFRSLYFMVSTTVFHNRS
ncbi:hypothetical protein EGR_01129 [Echinococcus granulosus]|uniref:Uncharacterized protein n=1 Tax=Echinococcus granulosus TaxID=6210 RepID=W6UTN7_ECHGR|nr:hypothetical protein EGR_01129 [Echinococcus granulosus]EUB64001.1 hypothetical protein EGR_01129 [Echinococcus granulosus]